MQDELELFTELLPVEVEFPFPSHLLVVEVNDFAHHVFGKPKRSRIIPNILHLLEHVDEQRAEANFYLPPGPLRMFPEIVPLVVSRGHELGLCIDLGVSGCLANLDEINQELEHLSGRITKGVLLKSRPTQGQRCLPKLAAAGYEYCFTNFALPTYSGLCSPFVLSSGERQRMIVFFPGHHRFLGVSLPYGQPGNIRLYPLWFLRRCLNAANASNQPAVLHFPLWEIDRHMPRLLTNPLKMITSFGNLSVCEYKLRRLLDEFDFVRVTRITQWLKETQILKPS